jgi:LysM repeat protein
MIKSLLKRTPPQQQAPKKRLRATAQRTSAKYQQDKSEAEEPNVKLSRAFVVVLLLHVVAVGGIFVFSALKDRQQASPAPGKGQPGGAKASLQANTIATSHNELTPAANSSHRVKPGETLASIAAAKGLTAHDLELANNLKPSAALTPGKELVIPDKAALRPVPLDVQKLVENPRTTSNPKTNNLAAGDKSTEETGRTYVVQRGDTPTLIAKRLKVSAAELLRLNNIEDPKKLQVGQKLAVP